MSNSAGMMNEYLMFPSVIKGRTYFPSSVWEHASKEDRIFYKEKVVFFILELKNKLLFCVSFNN